MPFTLRQATDTSNPTLARAFGEQTTYGQLAYYYKVGANTCFILLLAEGEKLGEGECDGVEWVRYGGHLLTPYDPDTGQGDYIFHSGTRSTGFDDPIQGVPTFLPSLGFTFSNKCYVEVRLPSNFSQGTDEPGRTEVKMRCSRIRDYDITGAIIAENYGPSANNMRVAAYCARLAGINIATRFDWPSWFAAKQYCDALIAWAQGGGDGLKGEYYNGANFGTLIGTRIDPYVNFTWGSASPPNVPVGIPYSVRWTGFVEAQYTETHTFYVTYDDGVKVWINDVLIIDDWNPGSAREASGTAALTAGERYSVKIEYFYLGGTTGGTGGATPIVQTNAASLISSEGARMNALVNPNGSATNYHFEWGETTAYGHSTSSTSAGSGSASVAVNSTLIALDSATVYHYRIVATNTHGTTYGADRTFYTRLIDPGDGVQIADVPSVAELAEIKFQYSAPSLSKRVIPKQFLYSVIQLVSAYGSNATWKQTTDFLAGWADYDYDDSTWLPSVFEMSIDSYDPIPPGFAAGSLAQRVWHYNSNASSDTDTVYFRKKFTALRTSGKLAIICDDNWTAYLAIPGGGGVEIDSGTITGTPGEAAHVVDLDDLIVGAQYLLSVRAHNTGGPGGLLAEIQFATGHQVERFSADVVLPGVPWTDALGLIMMRCPGIDWQDVDGKIKFLAGPDRPVAHTFFYDPTQATSGENWLVKSEQFNAADWTASRVTVTPNSVLAPPGALTASALAFLAGGFTPKVIQQTADTGAILTGRTFTFSAHLKAAAMTTLTLRMFRAGETPKEVTVTVRKDRWKRFTLTKNFEATSETAITVQLKNPTGHDAQTIQVWGAQLEESTVARIYTRTDAAAVKNTPTASNIVQNTVKATRRDPFTKPNFMIIGYRDKDDSLLTQQYEPIDRSALRDALGGHLVDAGIVQIGVAQASLAQRVGETIMRLAADLDTDVTLTGQKRAHKVAKGDRVQLVHPVGDWRGTPLESHSGPIDMLINRETFESSIQTANERSFIMQSYARDFYADYSHGPISGSRVGDTISPFGRAPKVETVTLAQTTVPRPDSLFDFALTGNVQFDRNYPYAQRGRIYRRWPANERIVTFDAVNDCVVLVAHAFPKNTPIKFSTTDSLGVQIDESTIYFVVPRDADSFKLATEEDGTPLEINVTGMAGVHRVAPFVLLSTVLVPDNRTRIASFSIPNVDMGLHEVMVLAETLFHHAFSLSVQTIYSIVVVPPAGTQPASLNGYFDEGGGDLQNDWPSDPYKPSPTREVYDLEYNYAGSASNIAGGAPRLVQITPVLATGLREPILWVKYYETPAVTETIMFLRNGGVTVSGDSEAFVFLKSKRVAEVRGGFLVQLEMPSLPTLCPWRIGVAPDVDLVAGSSGDRSFYMGINPADAPNYAMFIESGNGPFALVQGDIPYIFFRADGRVEYGINFHQSAVIFFVSPIAVYPDLLYRVFIYTDTVDAGQVEGLAGANWEREGPEWVYTSEMQRADFDLGGEDDLPDTIDVRVRRLSNFDTGLPSTWRAATFTR